MSSRTTRSPEVGGSETRAEGNKAVAVGRVLGNFVISLVVGDGLKNAMGDASTWRVWNWPPFLIVVGLGAAALVIAPEGAQSQYTGVYVLLGLAVLLAGARIVGIVAPPATKALVSALSVLLAVGALLWVDRLTEHGEVNVTGRAEVSGPAPVGDGQTLSVAVADAPSRTHLRLALTVRDAVPAAQSCTPETTLTVALRGGGADSAHTDVRAGQQVDLPLGGAKGVRVDVTVHTDPGCRMTVSVDNAVLHG